MNSDKKKQEYFWARIWTGEIALNGRTKFAVSRTSIRGVEMVLARAASPGRATESPDERRRSPVSDRLTA